MPNPMPVNWLQCIKLQQRAQVDWEPVSSSTLQLGIVVVVVDDGGGENEWKEREKKMYEFT